MSDSDKKTVAHTAFRTRNEIRGGTAVGKENPAAATEIKRKGMHLPPHAHPPCSVSAGFG